MGKGRVRVLDMLRGFSVISMVAYHAMYDLVYMFGLEAGWYRSLPGYIWQQSICWVFILVSGATQHYGRRPLRRAVMVLGAALLVSAVTFVFMAGERILFGILHCIGLCMLLCAVARPLLQRVPPALGLALSGALFMLCRGVPRGFIGLLEKPLAALPAAWYSTQLLFPLGLPGPGFFSADYFPLIPWLFLFLAGYFGWALIKNKVPPSIHKPNVLERVGRHSLLVYVLHQPVIYAVLLGLQYLGVL